METEEMEMVQPAPPMRRNAESGNSARAERRRGMVIDRKPLAPFAEPAVAEAARQEREEKKAEAKPQVVQSYHQTDPGCHQR